ncbi:hypothetical protein NDU88_004867 [Pleurodeles waltl]|uniref:Uncharacterized protein n=1 Tax=Pleurodeles waltl TaxID=8319 RepID=A0AAV7TA00_PLEWA|nr:hypothetical protein NDU88_004867 [Pleurodeles waltl]
MQTQSLTVVSGGELLSSENTFSFTFQAPGRFPIRGPRGLQKIRQHLPQHTLCAAFVHSAEPETPELRPLSITVSPHCHLPGIKKLGGQKEDARPLEPPLAAQPPLSPLADRNQVNSRPRTSRGRHVPDPDRQVPIMFIFAVSFWGEKCAVKLLKNKLHKNVLNNMDYASSALRAHNQLHLKSKHFNTVF